MWGLAREREVSTFTHDWRLPADQVFICDLCYPRKVAVFTVWGNSVSYHAHYIHVI